MSQLIAPGCIRLWRGGYVPCLVRIIAPAPGYPGMWHVREAAERGCVGAVWTVGERDLRAIRS